jgi:hypothetical protein
MRGKLVEEEAALAASEGDYTAKTAAGGFWRTSTRPTFNLLLLLSAAVSTFTLKVSHAPNSAQVLAGFNPKP